MQQFIAHFGYLAIFVLMVAESACIPIPSELTMPLGGALAAGAVAGAHLNLVLVVTAGVAGNLVGSFIAWAAGWYGGRAAWRKWGRFLLLRDADIDRSQRWFDRHGGKAVFFGRLLPVIRTFISLPAGFAKMRPVRFGIYTVAGCIPWTLALAWAGYAAGAAWQHVASVMRVPTYVLAGIVVLGLAAVIVMHVRRRRRDRAPAAQVPGVRPEPGSRAEPGAGDAYRERGEPGARGEPGVHGEPLRRR